MAAKTKNIPFEKAIEDLEKIISQLEQGDQPLEDQLKAFEQGVALSRDCMKRLEQVERQVQILVQGEGGQLEPRDFT